MGVMKAPGWLERALEHPAITDICLNGSAGAFADRGAGLEPLEAAWGEEELREWVLAQLSLAGKSWDARHPFVDATLPSGHRLHVAFPPLARQGILVSLRRPGTRGTELAARRWESSPL